MEQKNIVVGLQSRGRGHFGIQLRDSAKGSSRTFGVQITKQQRGKTAIATVKGGSFTAEEQDAVRRCVASQLSVKQVVFQAAARTKPAAAKGAHGRASMTSRSSNAPAGDVTGQAVVAQPTTVQLDAAVVAVGDEVAGDPDDLPPLGRLFVAYCERERSGGVLVLRPVS